jgi:signal peptidase II
MMRRIPAWGLVLFTVALVGCDHGTKLAAKRALEDERPVRLVKGVLDLRYRENHDSAFSLLRHVDIGDKPQLLAGLSLIGLSAVAGVWWWRQKQASSLEHVGYGLIIGGAIGNLLDRLARGFVVDFIHIHHWPVFNVADVLVALGGMTCVAALIRGRLQKKAPPPEEPRPPIVETFEAE